MDSWLQHRGTSVSPFLIAHTKAIYSPCYSHTACVPKLTFLKNKGQCFSLNETFQRGLYLSFFFFFLIEQQSPPHFFLPFPHSILQISKCFHHLCLICLFPFFLNAVSESLATALYTRMNSCNLHCWCCNILQGYFH